MVCFIDTYAENSHIYPKIWNILPKMMDFENNVFSLIKALNGMGKINPQESKRSLEIEDKQHTSRLECLFNRSQKRLLRTKLFIPPKRLQIKKISQSVDM